MSLSWHILFPRPLVGHFVRGHFSGNSHIVRVKGSGVREAIVPSWPRTTEQVRMLKAETVRLVDRSKGDLNEVAFSLTLELSLPLLCYFGGSPLSAVQCVVLQS